MTRADLLKRLALLPLIMGAGVAGAYLSIQARPAPGPRVADVLRPLAEVATAHVELRSIQRGTSEETSLLSKNRDEVLVAAVVAGDLGIPLGDLTPDRWEVRDGVLTIRLPPPRLLAPGLALDPVQSQELEVRTSRWEWTRRFSDPGPGQAAARSAALARAVAEAPAVFKRLGLDEDLRDTTRKAVRLLLPHLLGRPGLPVEVRFDDDPKGNG